MKYYLHSVDTMDDEKVSELFLRFGYEGTGLFHAILEKLAKQEKPIKTTILKYQLKVGKRLEKCWKFMEEIELISSNNGDTFNKQLLNYAERYKIKKEKNAKKIAEWRKNQDNTEKVTSYEPPCNASKVKESKVNRSKVIKEKEKEKIVKADALTPLHAPSIKIFTDWYEKKLGVKYPFQVQDAKGMKSVLSYLQKAITEKNNVPARPDEVLAGWKLILDKYDSWEPFYQSQIKLSQIAGNLANILSNIKGINRGTTGKQRFATNPDDIGKLVEIGFRSVSVSESTPG